MSTDITKQHITDSFNALFRKYPLEKITVNMIIENAGVSKSTFYRYFLDKFDVMNYNYKRVLDEIFAHNACKSWEDLFNSILSYIDNDIDRIKNAFLYLGDNSYDKYVFDYSFARMNDKCVEKNGRALSQNEIYTAKSLYTDAFMRCEIGFSAINALRKRSYRRKSTMPFPKNTKYYFENC